ncbi:MAG: amidohydrolase [Vicingaceae bacterium]
MEDLRVSLCQADIVWEDPQGNFKLFEQFFEQIEQTDLILLPEMFNTGFSMRSADLAEQMDGATVNWMRKQAEIQQAVICGSLIVEEEGKYFNRLVWMKPDGTYETYDKRHLFRMANENNHFSAGNKRLIVELKGWKIMPLVCYDLRFPVWSRNRFETDRNSFAKAEYDLLFYIANWPEPRVEAWKKLLAARAIENQAYVVGLNRIGTDGKDVPYSGGSRYIDTKGELMWKAEDHQTTVQTMTLSAKELADFRKKFPVGMDGDEFGLGV